MPALPADPLRWALPATALGQHGPGGRGGIAVLILLLIALLLPMAWPALHGLGGAAWTVWNGTALAGGGKLWPGARVGGLLANGLLLSLAAAAVAVVCAALWATTLLLPLARGMRLALLALLVASFCFGTVVHLMAWRALFPGVTGGAAGWCLAVLVLGLRYAPLAAALLVTGLAVLERAELETALCTGGASALWVVARKRLLRLAGMCAAAVAALVFCESELPPLVGVHVYAEEFLSQVALEPDPHVAAALGWPLMAVALACAALLGGLPRLEAASGGAVRLGWLGQWAHPPQALRAVLPTAALMLAACPLALLALGTLQATGRWPAHAGAALASSLWVAALSSLLAVIWGWALAAAAVRAGSAAVKAVNLLAWLAMLWPSALTGLAIAGLGMPDAFGAATPLVLAHALRLLPFCAWVLLALQDLQPKAPAEQLRVLGARGWAAMRHVRLPAQKAGLLAAWTLGAGLSLAELTATVLTVPPGMETVILRLYNLLHYGDQRGVMMLALLQGLAVAGLMAAGLLAAGRTRTGMDTNTGAARAGA